MKRNRRRKLDKITRVLLLYTKLIQGGKIDKISFCIEVDCLPRTFDRDIEDIRLYLSETFVNSELLYDRNNNVYYLSNVQRAELEIMEFKLIERLLLDSRVLCSDEMDNLLQHIASNAEKSSYLINKKNELLKFYKEPIHQKAILKMQGDLDLIIRNHEIINIRYEKSDGTYIERRILPCTLKYADGYIYLIAYISEREGKYPAYYRLDRIYSFEIVRKQSNTEIQQVEKFMQNYETGIIQMYGGEYTEIQIVCEKNFYPYLYDKFQNVEIIGADRNSFRVRLWAFSDGFVKWIMCQPNEKIKVMAPDNIIQTITKNAEQIILQYGR